MLLGINKGNFNRETRNRNVFAFPDTILYFLLCILLCRKVNGGLQSNLKGKFTVEVNGEKLGEFENEIYGDGSEGEIAVDFKQLTEDYYKFFIPYEEPHPDPELATEIRWQSLLLSHSQMIG